MVVRALTEKAGGINIRRTPEMRRSEQALKADAPRRKQDQRAAKALFAQTKSRSYLGGYSRVTDLIRPHYSTLPGRQ
jgi:hypothetical protein